MAKQIEFFGNYGSQTSHIGENQCRAIRIPLVAGLSDPVNAWGNTIFWSPPLDVRGLDLHGAHQQSWMSSIVRQERFWVSHLVEGEDRNDPYLTTVDTSWLGGVVYLDKREDLFGSLHGTEENGWRATTSLDRLSPFLQPASIYKMDRWNTDSIYGSTVNQAGFSSYYGILPETVGDSNPSRAYLKWVDGAAPTYLHRSGPHNVSFEVTGIAENSYEFSVSYTVKHRFYTTWGDPERDNLAILSTRRLKATILSFTVSKNGAVSCQIRYTGTRRGERTDSTVGKHKWHSIDADYDFTRSYYVMVCPGIPARVTKDPIIQSRRVAAEKRLREDYLRMSGLAYDREINTSDYRTLGLGDAVMNFDQLESNWIENLTGFSNPAELLDPIVNLSKALISFRRDKDVASLAKDVLRSISSAYLEWKYVIAPGVADYQDVRDNAFSLWEKYSTTLPDVTQRQHAVTKTQWDGLTDVGESFYSSTVHVVPKRDNLAMLWRALCAFGLEPVASNFWDLVPYSFVADWLVNFGDYLDGVSGLTTGLITYEIRYWSSTYQESNSVEWQPFDDCPVSFLQFHYATRKTGRSISDMPGITGKSLSLRKTPLSLSQSLQGGALIVQRLL